MKKVIFVTANKIMGVNGGSLNHRKIYSALHTLKKNNKINEFEAISLDTTLEKKANVIIKKSKVKDVLSRLFFHSVYMFLYKNEIKKYIIKNNFNIVILGNSRLGFIAKALKRKKDIKVITNFDNIEVDYCDSAYSNAKNIKKLAKVIEKRIVLNDEKSSIKYSDSLCFITKRDQDRAKELYDVKGKSSYVYPICLEKNDELSNCTSSNILFVGTLNYASNVQAIKNFIPIFNNQTYFKKFIIAGSNPNDEFYDIIKNNENIETHINFDKYSDFAHKGDILVSFIDKGAGMKVKVAEAMSLGIIVCGSSETFAGYEQVINNGALFECNTPSDYIETLEKLSKLSNEKIITLANKNIHDFSEYYSMDISCSILFSVLEDTNGNS